MLDACDRLGVLVMDELTDMWTESKSDFDAALDFPEWWERDVEAMVRKDVNHPSVVFYSIGNEIPEVGRPHGAVWSRRLAEKVRSLDDTRLVTNGINAMLARHRRGEGRRRPQAGINTMLTDMGAFMDELSRSELVATRTAESFDVLDVAGMNYMEARYEIDRELFPRRVIVGSETFPGKIDRLWRLVLDNPHVIGDFTWTGWDYLGEAGVGRVDDRRRPDRGPVRRALPVAARARRRHRHHRAPPAGVLLPGDRLRPAQRPVHRGAPPGAARPRAVGHPVGVERHGRQLELGRRGGQAGHRRGLQRRRRGRAAAGRRLARHRAGGGEEPVPRRVRGDVRARRADRRRAHRRRGDRTVLAAVGVRAGRRWPLGADRAAIRADDEDLAYLGITLQDAGGHGGRRRRPRGDGVGRGPGRAGGLRQRRTRRPRSPTSTTSTPPSTAARWPSSARPAPEPSP